MVFNTPDSVTVISAHVAFPRIFMVIFSPRFLHGNKE